MRTHPTAFAWVDPDTSESSELDKPRVRRLARRLGYRLYWPPPSLLPVIDQVRAADVDVVLVPSPGHLDVMQLHALMCFVDVESALPRMSFGRWTTVSSHLERS
ncbi:hypothetical protein [Nocardia blacklockiae]|uniref:hypothetical protein n=1 Tax=Nocardia blacklockiae TaxID=480036 RepID=UPI0018936A89|nr:hypothetical protein [Nocardia blacklockiae]MBF6172024.1 hypothetical protein [Nocardia blacklockiae]